MGTVFLPLLLVALVSMVAGIIFGRLWSTSKTTEQQEEDESDSESPPPDALYIWRDLDTQDFVLRFGERVYRSSEELTRQEKQTFSTLFARLQDWLGITTALPQAPPPETASPPEEEEEKVGITPAKVLASVMPSAPEPPPSSIVAQIDEILQQKLTSSPLKDRGISLQESPDGGMYVMVGLEKYESVETVPQEEIKVIIQAAVAEWEKQS